MQCPVVSITEKKRSQIVAEFMKELDQNVESWSHKFDVYVYEAVSDVIFTDNHILKVSTPEMGLCREESDRSTLLK